MQAVVVAIEQHAKSKGARRVGEGRVSCRVLNYDRVFAQAPARHRRVLAVAPAYRDLCRGGVRRAGRVHLRYVVGLLGSASAHVCSDSLRATY